MSEALRRLFGRDLRRLRMLWLAPAFCWVALLPAQDAQPPTDTPQQPSQPQTTSLATVHGVVRNAVSGSPLPRALVRIDGDANNGALTDGDGRFEIPGVPVGPQEFSVIKPGYIDEPASVALAGSLPSAWEFGHNVIVEAEMPDVVFMMSPVNAIRGQISLSTGEPAQGIGVTLLRQRIQGGRVVWQMETHSSTNADGVYRFGSLADGLYVVHTDLAMESELGTTFVESGGGANVARSGYAARFYPEARDLNGAARIQLHGGETAEADVSLALEPFHPVTATVLFPGGRTPPEDEPGLPRIGYSATVTDQQGHQLFYPAQYDPSRHTVQALLPDGAYSLLITAFSPRELRGVHGTIVAYPNAASFVGSTDFSVAGRAIGNLRAPLAAVRGSPVQVNLTRSGTVGTQPDRATQRQETVTLTLTDATGSTGDGMVVAYAEGPISGPLNTNYTQPGSYWVHTTLHDPSVCEGSLMAGGANLGHEPLLLGLTGPTEPLSLNLRDDCASLTLTLPAVLTAQTAGEEPFYTVYVVPDFDSTADFYPETLRASTGGRVTLHGLTPGSYHVYSFDKPAALAYHNKDALAALPNPGQEIELAPGATANLVVEALKP